jgi:hypothetical protein
MTKHAFWLLSTVVALGFLTTPVLNAQDTTKKEVKVTPDTVRKEAKGEVAKMPTYAAVISAVSAATPTAAKIDALAELKAEQIRIVDAKELVDATNETEFSAALEQNKAAIETLRASLQKNQLVAKAIADHPAKPAITDIVAADVTADGDLIIWFHRKS